MATGNCVDIAPGYFDQSEDDGTVRLLLDEVAVADVDIVDQAAMSCPVGALLVSADREARNDG
jgi:ferredoxin